MSKLFPPSEWIDVSSFFSDGANGVRTYIPRDPLKRIAIAAGTQSAETNEDLAQSEGCQSGPKGIARKGNPA